MKIAITLTTINIPYVIKSYMENINKFSHKDIEFIIVTDKKTPEEAKDYTAKLSKNFGIKINYLDLQFQTKYLKRFKALDKYLPYNSFARRNIGDMFAYEEGFDIIIRVDDDNYPTEEDFISFHKNVGKKININVISSKSGWFNICDELVDKNSVEFYPRGYLYDKRWIKSPINVNNRNVKLVLNAGLWLGDPDIDAITRLARPIDAIKYKRSFGDLFALDKNTWSPINTQNTAYSREIIPAAFVPPNVGRYDDIWSGYLLRKISDYFDDYISYGSPLLYQKRNMHNLWDDLDKEINGNIYTKHFIDVINSIEFKKKSYQECYYELAEYLDENIMENKKIFSGVTEGMKIWIDSINQFRLI